MHPIFSNPKNRRAWVIYQVSLKGQTLASVARDAGVSRQAIYHAFRRPYPRMEKVIADAVGLAPQVLFPERYGEDGQPNRPMGRPKKSVVTSSQNNSRRKRRNVSQAGAV